MDDGWLLPAATAWSILGQETIQPEAGRPRGPAIQFGQGRLYGMEELTQRALGVGWTGTAVGRSLKVSGRWQELGSSLWSERTVEAIVSIGRSPGVGLTATRWERVLPGYEVTAHHAASLRLELQKMLQNGLRSSLVIWFEMTDPPIWFGAMGRRPWLQADLWARGLGLALAVDRTVAGAIRLQVEALIRLAPSTGVCVRADLETATLGTGIFWGGSVVRIRTSHLVHPDLGVTHRLSLEAGLPEALAW